MACDELPLASLLAKCDRAKIGSGAGLLQFSRAFKGTPVHQ